MVSILLSDFVIQCILTFFFIFNHGIVEWNFYMILCSKMGHSHPVQSKNLN